MKDFITLIEKNNIPELEQMSDIPIGIARIFIDICKQVSRGVLINNIIDVNGLKLSETYGMFMNMKNPDQEDTDPKVPRKFNDDIENKNDLLDNPKLEKSDIMINKKNKKKISHENIKKFAQHIHQMVLNGKTKHPNFDNRCKSVNRKIKNYLHNLTHIWFNPDDINLFIKEFNELKLSSNSSTI